MRTSTRPLEILGDLRLRLPSRRQTSARWRATAKRVGPELAGTLEPLRRRAYLDNAVRWALSALALWAAATALVLAWSKLSPTGGTWVFAIVLGACVFAGASTAWALARPLPLEVARVADARLDLKERLASALFFADHPGGTGHNPMYHRLEADAVTRAREHRPAEAFPLQRHSRRAIAAVAAVVVLGALAFTPNPQAATLARRSADRAVIGGARKTVASARKQVRRVARGQREGARAEAELQRALAELQKARTPLQALSALSALESELSSLPNLSNQEEAAAAAAGAALAGAPGAAKLSQDLTADNLKAAASDLRKLAQQIDKLGAAQQRALANALKKAAAQAGANGSGARSGPGPSQQASQPSSSSQSSASSFANELSQAAQALASGKKGSASNYLGSAAHAASASAQAASLQQQLAAAQAAVRNAQAQVASEAQADSNGRGAKVARSASTNGHRNKGNDSSSHYTSGSGQGKSGRLGAMTGRGTGSGTGSGQGNGSGKSRGGSGAGSGNGSGTKSGVGRSSDQVFVGGQPASTEQVVGKHLANGSKVKTTNYQQVLPSFEKTALQGLGSQVVSPADQDLVRNYFSSLGGQTAKSETGKKG